MLAYRPFLWQNHCSAVHGLLLIVFSVVGVLDRLHVLEDLQMQPNQLLKTALCCFCFLSSPVHASTVRFYT